MKRRDFLKTTAAGAAAVAFPIVLPSIRNARKPCREIESRILRTGIKPLDKNLGGGLKTGCLYTFAEASRPNRLYPASHSGSVFYNALVHQVYCQNNLYKNKSIKTVCYNLSRQKAQELSQIAREQGFCILHFHRATGPMGLEGIALDTHCFSDAVVVTDSFGERSGIARILKNRHGKHGGIFRYSIRTESYPLTLLGYDTNR